MKGHPPTVWIFTNCNNLANSRIFTNFKITVYGFSIYKCCYAVKNPPFNIATAAQWTFSVTYTRQTVAFITPLTFFRTTRPRLDCTRVSIRFCTQRKVPRASIKTSAERARMLSRWQVMATSLYLWLPSTPKVCHPSAAEVIYYGSWMCDNWWFWHNRSS